MNMEDLIAMGLTEEQAKKVMDSLDGNYVTKTRFNEVNEENKTLKQTVSDRDKQLDDLKKSSGDSAELKKQIEDLQQQNADNKAAYEKEMAQLKLDNAVENALTAAGVKNNKALRALLDPEKIKLDDSGKLSGLEEQLKEVRKSDPYMFAEKDQGQTSFKGFQPGASSDVKPSGNADFSKMTYSEMTASGALGGTDLDVELMIASADGSEFILPAVEEGIEWTTQRRSTPGKLVFKVIKDDRLTAYRIEQLEKKVDKHNQVIDRVIKHDKHIANNIIPPENNPDSDSYILKYRKYGLVDVYANKVAGIYLSHKPAEDKKPDENEEVKE